MKFVIIIPFRNCKRFLNECLDSISIQEYKNYRVILCDDNSDDNYILPQLDFDYKLRINNVRLTALESIHNCLVEEDIGDDEVVVLVDGDDALLNKDSLTILNDIYTKKNPLLTYGQYLCNGRVGHCYSYTKFEFNNLRRMDWRASHLKTFRKALYSELLRQDPETLCHKDINGEFYKMTSDISLFHPMMEIAGFDRVKFIIYPLYKYRTHENNDDRVNVNLQKQIEIEIKNKQQFNETSIV